MKEKSCGAIVYKMENGELKFLLVHQSNGHYSFPKGHMEEGENPFQTALREFEEETSVKLSDNPIEYECFGRVRQNKKKSVYVYAKEYNGEDLTNCYSNSCISIINGVEYEHKEIKDYKWITIDDYKVSGIKAYIPYLEEIINRYGNNS